MPTMIKMIPIIAAGFTPRILQGATAADQLQNENDQRDEQQDVNVGAKNVEAHESEQPENEQNNEYCPKHINLSVLSCYQWIVLPGASAPNEI